MGAYGKAYALLYLIGAVTILTSCVKDDLYDTPHPDRGAVVVTTDWSGKSTESDIQLVRFELSVGYLIYILSKRWTIKPISRFNRSPKR